MWRPRIRRKKSPAAGQVWRCNDPRQWSGGDGGHHYVVLLADEGGGNWRAAVIETSPPNAVIVVNEPGIGVYGGIRLPTTVLTEKNLGAFKGNLGSIRAAKYDERLAEATLECAATARRRPAELEGAIENRRIAGTSDDAE